MLTVLLRWRWQVLVVDEAHRLKNQNSLLHKVLTQVQSYTWFGLSDVCFFVFPIFISNFPLFISCVVLSWFQSPADGDAHPEQPAGTLLSAELHSAQHLHS